MCGICGKIASDSRAPVDEGLVRKMVERLRHRGPDDHGTASGLGHARLSILDLTGAARQPMANEDENLLLVFNGAIYNFEELRANLETRGHRFRSSSDSEVVLHLYEEHGVRCLDRLRGMFAFAIYDRRNHTLFAARDRVGKKPLLYAQTNDALVFASEFRALLADPAIETEPDPEAIDVYLSYQYIPAPLTAYKGIRKLPPAHYMLYSNGKLDLRRYWRLNRVESVDATEEALREKLEEAVRIRLKSDVPLGVLLSGGLDSSAVAAYARRHVPGRLKTFSIGFEEPAYNESIYAKAVAEHLDTDHTDFTVKPDAVSIVPELVRHYGEPFADSSAIPCFHLARLASQEVKVVLGGDGGDESFAGYDRYRAMAAADRLCFFSSAATRLLGKGITRLAKPGSKVDRFFRHAAEPPVQRYFHWICYVDDALKEKLYTGDFKAHRPGWSRLTEAYRTSNALDRILDVDLETYLPGDLLVKMDIALMAHGLEGRSPFLDHELMEFAASIPSHQKLKRFRTKHILKEAMKPLLPDRIVNRRKKGFGVPIDLWLRNELKEMVYDVLTGPRASQRGWFNINEVRSLLDAHMTGRLNLHREIWALLMLELWFMDR